MKVLKIKDALTALEKISDEISHRNFLEEEGFSMGFIAFKPGGAKDPKQINHRDKDVVCHVLSGRGRLRLVDQTIHLEPGIICHLPKGTPHDFAAENDEELVLFYSLIRTEGQSETLLNSKFP